METQYGVISTWADRGFGYILHSSRERQYFFHISNFLSVTQPAPGLIVSFNLAPSHNPRYQEQAVAIRIVSRDEAKAGIAANLAAKLAAEALAKPLESAQEPKSVTDAVEPIKTNTDVAEPMPEVKGGAL